LKKNRQIGKKNGAGGTLWDSAGVFYSRSGVSRILFPSPSPSSGLEGDHFSGPAVASRLKQPTRGCAGLRRRVLWPRLSAYLALLPVGFAMPLGSPPNAVRSYRTISPLPEENPFGISPGGLLSVALSVGLLRLDVIKHQARQGGLTRPSAVRTFLTAGRTLRCDRHVGRDGKQYNRLSE